MKRFLLFAGETYYPEGGWDDFKSDHETMDEAVCAKAAMREFDWWQIVDTETATTDSGISDERQSKIDAMYAVPNPAPAPAPDAPSIFSQGRRGDQRCVNFEERLLP